jgi:hypothetical protein
LVKTKQCTADILYSTKVAEEQITQFVASPEAKLELVEGGAHYLSASNPSEVNDALLALVTKYTKPAASVLQIHLQ